MALPESYNSIVNLGIQLNHWDHLAAPWLMWMEQHLPDSATQVVAEYSEALMRQVRDGVLELAVVYQPQHSQGIVIEHLVSESLVLVSTEPREISSGQTPAISLLTGASVSAPCTALLFRMHQPIVCRWGWVPSDWNIS